jgi:hypothetical protein
MTEQKKWGETGRELAVKLNGATDEEAIKSLGEAASREILNRESTSEGRANALKMVNRKLLKHFPRLRSEAPAYWYDPKGKESQPKWRHLIFKYLTLSSSDWDEVGDEARLEWKATQTQTEQPSNQPTEQLTIQAMTIQQLDLDAETQEILESALEQSSLTLPDFIKQAVRVYAKTITGKTRKQGEDLSTVSTAELLSDARYRTHPGRADELSKRAIRAIKIYNSEIATENAARWMITQSAIASLTGSRQASIKEVLPKYQTSIDENNLNPDWGLTPYTNRKPVKIEDAMNLSELVPDGID